MSEDRRCAVGVLQRDDKVLLGLRSAERRIYPAKWDFFGGHAEPGESLEDCLVRELQEELDVTATAYSPSLVFAEPYPALYGAGAYHLYLVTDWQGPGPRIANDEHSEMGWFTPQDALRLDLAAEGYRDVLRTL